MSDSDDEDAVSPLEALRAIAVQDVDIAPALAHLEIYTLRGLLTVLWHGPRDAEDVVLMGGGAMGGLLGPADGLYHDLGVQLAREHGIGSIRMSYRVPNDLTRCVHDMLATADLAGRNGGRKFITMGHSFGGAVAVNAGIALRNHAAGIVTLSTQSAGCENADAIGDAEIPFLLFHGERDELLPPMVSEVVHGLAGGSGELVFLPDTGHLLSEVGPLLRERLTTWIPEHFATYEPRLVEP